MAPYILIAAGILGVVLAYRVDRAEALTTVLFLTEMILGLGGAGAIAVGIVWAVLTAAVG